jgi:hypothetical protein
MKRKRRESPGSDRADALSLCARPQQYFGCVARLHNFGYETRADAASFPKCSNSSGFVSGGHRASYRAVNHVNGRLADRNQVLFEENLRKSIFTLELINYFDVL